MPWQDEPGGGKVRGQTVQVARRAGSWENGRMAPGALGRGSLAPAGSTGWDHSAKEIETSFCFHREIQFLFTQRKLDWNFFPPPTPHPHPPISSKFLSSLNFVLKKKNVLVMEEIVQLSFFYEVGMYLQTQFMHIFGQNF